MVPPQPLTRSHIYTLFVVNSAAVARVRRKPFCKLCSFRVQVWRQHLSVLTPDEKIVGITGLKTEGNNSEGFSVGSDMINV